MTSSKGFGRFRERLLGKYKPEFRSWYNRQWCVRSASKLWLHQSEHQSKCSRNYSGRSNSSIDISFVLVEVFANLLLSISITQSLTFVQNCRSFFYGCCEWSEESYPKIEPNSSNNFRQVFRVIFFVHRSTYQSLTKRLISKESLTNRH